jgi:hypothetical protein
MFTTLACGNKNKTPDDPTLINGEPVKPGMFPEVVYISMGNGRCTATLVSPTALITAAHCAKGGESVSFMHKQNRYQARCYGHPKYPQIDVDVSVCKLERPILDGYDEKYAFVGGEAKKGNQVTIAGYGCIRPGGGGGNDGILRWGEAKITGFTGYDMISKFGVALCFGDSGGPLYMELKDPTNEKHILLGVNSKGNIEDTNYNLRLDLPEVRDFLAAKAAEMSFEICGINSECVDKDPEPEPEPEPSDCNKEKTLFEFYLNRANEAEKDYNDCMAM